MVQLLSHVECECGDLSCGLFEWSGWVRVEQWHCVWQFPLPRQLVDLPGCCACGCVGGGCGRGSVHRSLLPPGLVGWCDAEHLPPWLSCGYCELRCVVSVGAHFAAPPLPCSSHLRLLGRACTRHPPRSTSAGPLRCPLRPHPRLAVPSAAAESQLEHSTATGMGELPLQPTLCHSWTQPHTLPQRRVDVPLIHTRTLE